MAPKTDQLFKEKFSKFVQEKRNYDDDDDDDDDDEYTSKPTLGRIGRIGSGMDYDEELDGSASIASRGKLGGLSKEPAWKSRSTNVEPVRMMGRIGATGIGNTGIGATGIGGTGIGGLRRGIGGLNLGPSTSANTNAKASTSANANANASAHTGVNTSANVTNDVSKALEDIAKGTANLQKEIVSLINNSQTKNVDAFKEIIHFIHGLQDKTVLQFKELSRNSNKNVDVDETPADDIMKAIISNIDKKLKEETDVAYILLPQNSKLDIKSFNLTFKHNVAHNVNELFNKIMSTHDNFPVSAGRSCSDEPQDQDKPVGAGYALAARSVGISGAPTQTTNRSANADLATSISVVPVSESGGTINASTKQPTQGSNKDKQHVSTERPGPTGPKNTLRSPMK